MADDKQWSMAHIAEKGKKLMHTMWNKRTKDSN